MTKPQDWGWSLEKKFLDELGDHNPNRPNDKNRAQWLEAYIVANELPNLQEQSWRKEALCYARKLLDQEKIRQGY